MLTPYTNKSGKTTMNYKYPMVIIPAAGRTVEEVDDAAHDILGGNIEWMEFIGDYLVLGFDDDVGECHMLHDEIKAGPTIWYHIGMREDTYEYWSDDPNFRPEGDEYILFDKPAKQFELKHLSVNGKYIYSWKGANELAHKQEPTRSLFNRFWNKEKM